MEETKDKTTKETAVDLHAVYEIPLQVSVVVGKTTMTVGQLVRVVRGTVIPLDRKVGEAVDLYVGGRVVAKGEITLLDDGKIGITITEMNSPTA